MATPNLGRLEQVPLREIWKTESGDFTPWLAQEENLRLLGEAIGLDLELQSRERNVGLFRADLLCKNTADGSWVLIENQIARTDHPHLGQILTYAAGLEAVTVVWIAERFTEEHRAALDWLNEITLDTYAFLGLEMELWRIGDSPVAPKFNIVSKPNDWLRSVQSTVKNGELTENEELRLRYWTAFTEYMSTRSRVKCQKPSHDNSMQHPLGRTGAYLSSVANLWNRENLPEPENRVELVLDGAQSKSWYLQLEQSKKQIESELGQHVVWHTRDDSNVRKVLVATPAEIRDEKLWPEQFDWLRRNLELFGQVFSPRVRAL